MSLFTPKKLAILLAALAASLCLATTPAIARGPGGGSHIPHFSSGGGHHSFSIPHSSGPSHFRSSPRGGNTYAAPRSQGNPFTGGRQGAQRQSPGPNSVPSRIPGQVTPRGGVPPQAMGSPQSPRGPGGPGGQGMQGGPGPGPGPYAGGGYGYVPEPPDQGVDPLEVLSQVLSIVSGIMGY